MPCVPNFLRVALSTDHCVAFEMAFQTVLVGSRCRNFEIRAWSVLVAVPVLRWWCLRAMFRLGRSAAFLEAPSCVLRVLLSIDNCIVFGTAFRTVPVRSHSRKNLRSRRLSAVLGVSNGCERCVPIAGVDRCCAFRSLNCDQNVARVLWACRCTRCRYD